MHAAHEHPARLGETERPRAGVERQHARAQPRLEHLEAAHVVEGHVGVDELEAGVATERSPFLRDDAGERLGGVGRGARDAERAAGFVQRQAERGADERVLRGTRLRRVLLPVLGVEERGQCLRVRKGQGEHTRVAVDLGRQVRDGHHQQERELAPDRCEVAEGAHDPGVGQPRVEIEHHARDAGLVAPDGALDARERLARRRVVGPAAGRRPLEDARAPERLSDEAQRAPLLVRHDADDRHPRRGGGAKVAYEGVAHGKTSIPGRGTITPRSSRAALPRSSSRPSRAS